MKGSAAMFAISLTAPMHPNRMGAAVGRVLARVFPVAAVDQGRSVAGFIPAMGSGAEADSGDAPDLADRVRAVGEW